MSMPVLKLRQPVKFPANVYGDNGIDVSKANGNYIIETDWSDFPSLSGIPTSPTVNVLSYDTLTGVYALVPTTLLTGADAGTVNAIDLIGSTLAPNVVHSSLQTVGTLVGGSTGSGFTINLSASAITGTLPIANGGTAATTAPAALTNLGALPLAGGTMGGFLILNADPSAALGAVTKQYVDNLAAGLSVKGAVAVATTANITLSGEQTIDGVLTSGSRVLVKNQSSPANNGIYISAAGAWSRATDLDAWDEAVGAYTFVSAGSTQANTGWVAQVAASGIIGSTAMPWAQFSSQASYTAGPGVSLSGTNFLLAPGSVTSTMLANYVSVAKGGTGQDFSASTGVPILTAGVASVTTSLALTGLTVSGNVGIGAAALSIPLRVHTGTNANVDFANSGGVAVVQASNDAFSALAPLLINASTLSLNSGAAGNVGIGTTSPNTKLSVVGAAVYNNSFSFAGTLFVGDSASAARGIDIGYDPSLEAGFIQAGKAGVSYKPLLLNPNTSGGNVGIGITAPLTKLHVDGGQIALTTASNLSSIYVSGSQNEIGFNLNNTQSGGKQWIVASAATASTLGAGLHYFNATDSLDNLWLDNFGNTYLLNLRVRRGSPWADVKAWGALADGSNDAPSIQAAIDYVHNTVGGGIVFVPPGTYVVGSTLVLKKNVILMGAGQKASIISSNGVDMTVLTVGSTPFNGNDGQGIEKIQFVGNQTAGATTAVVDILGNVSGHMRDCWVIGGYYALQTQGVDFTFDNCNFHSTSSISGGACVYNHGGGWFLRCKIDNNSTVSYGLLQGWNGGFDVSENHYDQCDFTGPFTYSIYVNDQTSGTNITVFNGCVISQDIEVAGARWTCFSNCEIAGHTNVSTANGGHVTIHDSYGFGGVTAGGSANIHLSNNVNIT